MLRMNNRIALGSNLGKSIGNGTTSRYMSDLDGVADYYTIPTVTLAGDLKIETDFSTTDTTTFNMILGHSSIGDYVQIRDGNKVQTVLNGTSNISPVITSVADGKLHTLKIERISSVLKYYIDNVEIHSIANADTANFNFIGRFQFGEYFIGVISEVKITDGTDLIRYYKIDEDFSTTDVLKNSATTLGSELWTNPPSTIGARWTDNGGGSYSHTGATGDELIITTAGLVEDAAYLCTLVKTGTGAVRFHLGGAPTNGYNISETITTAGTYTFALRGESVTTDSIRIEPINTTAFEVSGITVKKAEGYGEAISITSSELFTLEGADWIGSELVTNGDFSVDANWTKNTNTSISGGEGVSDGSNVGTVIGFEQEIGAISGAIYKVNFDINSISGSNLAVTVSTSVFSYKSAIGSYSEIIEANDTEVKVRYLAGTISTIDNVSVKRILQAP